MSAENQRKGGLVESSSSECDADDGQPKNMDEVIHEDVDPMEEDDDEEEEEDVELVFPDPVPMVEYSKDGTEFRFLVQNLPNSFASIPPQILKSMGSWDEATAKQKAAIAFNPCMPMPVHGSPIVSMVENKAVIPAGEKIAPKMQLVPKTRFISFTRSCYELHQLKLACANGLIKFHPSFTPSRLGEAVNEYAFQQKRIETTQNLKIDSLYAKASDPALMVDMKQVLAEFVSLIESYALQYIHLLEYFIYTCLVAPHGGSIPLEACLTPNVFPSLGDCIVERRMQVVKDMIEFFTHKIETRAKQEAENAANGVQNTDAPPLQKLRLDDVADIIFKEGRNGAVVYNGYIPLRTIYEYFCFMDCDGMLGGGSQN